MPRTQAWDRIRERLRYEGEYNPSPMRLPVTFAREKMRPVYAGIYGVSGLGDVFWDAKFPMRKVELFDYIDEEDCIFYNGIGFELKGIIEEIPDKIYTDISEIAYEISRYIERKGIAQT
ncbi:MAG: hypothetical protein QXT63_01335 [Thermoplasmata archaeon]